MKKVEEAIGKVLRGVSAACLGIVFVLFILNVATRLPFFNYTPTWIDETIQFFLVWSIFTGAAELVRIRGHFIVDVLTDKLHGTAAGQISAVISSFLMLAVYSIILFFGIRLCMKSNAAMYTIPFMKKSYFYSCIPVTAVFMVLFTLRDLILNIMDVVTHGEITKKMDAEKAKLIEEDEDAKIIAEAANALKQDEAEKGPNSHED